MLPTERGLNLEETARDHPGRPVPEASLRPSPPTRFVAIDLPQPMIAAQALRETPYLAALRAAFLAGAFSTAARTGLPVR